MNVDEILSKLKSANLLSNRDFNLGFVDTGSYALNKIISGKYNGGFPIGHITEIMGESSTAKTVFLTHGFIGAQKKGWITIMLDNEFSYSPEFAKLLGLDPSKLLYDDPLTVPECFARAEELIAEIREVDKDTPILIGLDSMAGQSDKESDKKIDEFDNMDGANRAKEINQCLRHINPILRRDKVGMVVINQVRAKPGVLYGDPTTRSGGGKSLEFYCGVCLKTISNSTSDVLEVDKKVVGKKGKVRNTKNKISIPFQECEFELLFDKGLNRYYGLGEAIEQSGLLTKGGAGWYTDKATGKKFQGEINLQAWIAESPDFLKWLQDN